MVAVFFGVILSDLGVYIISSGWTAPLRLGALIAPMLLQATITALFTPWVFGLMGWATRSVGLHNPGQRE